MGPNELTSNCAKPEKPRRKAAIREANEAAIIAAAEKLFAKHGYRGCSISMVATLAGVPKSNVYHYFDDKDALYEKVLDRTHKWWSDAALVFDRYDNPVDALGTYIDRKMDMSRENYYGSKVWASEVIAGAPKLRGYLETEVNDWVEKQVSQIRRWIEEGRMKPVDPLALLIMIWSTTQWYADFECQIRILNAGKDFDDEEFDKAKATVREIILSGTDAIGYHRSSPYRRCERRQWPP